MTPSDRYVLVDGKAKRHFDTSCTVCRPRLLQGIDTVVKVGVVIVVE